MPGLPHATCAPRGDMKPDQDEQGVRTVLLAPLRTPPEACSVKAALQARLKLWLRRRRVATVLPVNIPVLGKHPARIATWESIHKLMVRWHVCCVTRGASRTGQGLLLVSRVLLEHTKTSLDKPLVQSALEVGQWVRWAAYSVKTARPARPKMGQGLLLVSRVLLEHTNTSLDKPLVRSALKVGQWIRWAAYSV